MQISVYGPDHHPEGGITTTVFAPRPYNGNVYNTDGRYDYVAKQLGVVVIAAEAPGTGRVYIDKAERRSLRPATFTQVTAEYAYAYATSIHAWSGHLPVRIGLGDSGRAGLIAGMALHRPDLFTHVLCRDGCNLHAPESVHSGATRLLTQPNRGLHPVSPEAAQHLKTFQRNVRRATAVQNLTAFLRGPMEMAAYGKLMCSTNSAQTMLALAAQPTAPVMYVGFTEGLSGTPEQAHMFSQQLIGQRDAAGGGVAAELRAPVVFGRHADLTNPDLLLDHLRQTSTLQTVT
jgi:hypothetical protein